MIDQTGKIVLALFHFSGGEDKVAPSKKEQQRLSLLFNSINYDLTQQGTLHQTQNWITFWSIDKVKDLTITLDSAFSGHNNRRLLYPAVFKC